MRLLEYVLIGLIGYHRRTFSQSDEVAADSACGSLTISFGAYYATVSGIVEIVQERSAPAVVSTQGDRSPIVVFLACVVVFVVLRTYIARGNRLERYVEAYESMPAQKSRALSLLSLALALSGIAAYFAMVYFVA